MTVQHRIYLGRAHAGADLAAARTHWHHRHAPVVRDLPRLRGYVQNRPIQEWETRTPWFTCAETWFDHRDDEQLAYASEYYREVVATDELNVITPVDAWNAAVTGTDTVRDGPRTRFRVLGFGHWDTDPAVLPGTGRVEILRLRRPTPDGADRVVASWAPDESAARRLAGYSTGTTLLCTVAAIVGPVDTSWPRTEGNET